MRPEEVEDIEISLLLDAIQQRYGYDFKNYGHASIKRRIRNLLSSTGYQTISEMISPLLHDILFFKDVLSGISVTVSEMFRDPSFFMALRHQVIPYLQTFPYIKIWHAGCATGEEVYSLAIVLKEEGFYDRATIFATDINDISLERAREGIYSLEKMRAFTTKYQRAGGTGSFAQYYHSAYDAAIMDESLKENITFANHNLTLDGIFSEVHLVLCRNVLIYFNKILQNQVLKLFCDSLVRGGVLALGNKESLRYTTVSSSFKTLNSEWKLFQKISP